MAQTPISRFRCGLEKVSKCSTLDNDVTTTTLHFDNPTRSNTLIITPPDPQTTNEGNILGHSPRQLGIGMVEIKVVVAKGLSNPCPADFRAGQRLSWQDVNHTAAVVHQPTVR